MQCRVVNSDYLNRNIVPVPHSCNYCITESQRLYLSFYTYTHITYNTIHKYVNKINIEKA